MRLLKAIAAAAIGAASLIAVDATGSALTGWQTFAYSRDQYYPSVGVTGGTLTNPEWVRIVLNDGSYTGTSYVSAYINCYGPSYETWSRSLGADFTVPRYIVWDAPSWSRTCHLSVSAYNSAPYGVLSVSIQARYH